MTIRVAANDSIRGATGVIGSVGFRVEGVFLLALILDSVFQNSFTM